MITCDSLKNVKSISVGNIGDLNGDTELEINTDVAIVPTFEELNIPLSACAAVKLLGWGKPTNGLKLIGAPFVLVILSRFPVITFQVKGCGFHVPVNTTPPNVPTYAAPFVSKPGFTVLLANCIVLPLGAHTLAVVCVHSVHVPLKYQAVPAGGPFAVPDWG